jgi:replicative DNA helicase
MDFERLLLSKLIFTGQVEEAQARMITEVHFADDECQTMWNYLVKHTRRYKSTPSLEIVKMDFPDFDFIQIGESLEWVIDRFAVHVKRRFADEALISLGQAADDPSKHDDIDLEFLRVAQEMVQHMPTGKVSRFSEAEKRIEDYEDLKKKGKRLGIPYGLPTLDNALGGIFPHELVTILGWTNKGKSTLCRVIAYNMWLQGYSPQYFSLEMGDDEILREFDALGAKLDRQKMKQLDLSPEQMANWREFAASMSEKACDISIIDPYHKITPDYVYAEMLRHKPSVAIIDYVGLMRPNGVSRGVNRYAQLVEITQDLKWIARSLRIPIIMAAQTSRAAAKDGADLENIADGISIGQDSDTVIGLHQDEDMEKINEMEVRVNKSRSGPRPKFRMIWNHAETEYREKTFRDMFQREGVRGDQVAA